jgi:general secretion pathway protein H
MTGCWALLAWRHKGRSGTCRLVVPDSKESWPGEQPRLLEDRRVSRGRWLRSFREGTHTMVTPMNTGIAGVKSLVVRTYRSGRDVSGPPRLVCGLAGFTLIELVAVLAIMALAIGLVVPAMEAGLRTRTVWRETRQFASTLRYLRAEAVTGGEIQQLVIDPALSSYQTSAFDKPIRLSTEAAFISVQGGSPVGGDTVRVLFFPNGGTSGLEAIVGAREDEGGARYRVTLDPLIGAVSIGDARA